MGGGAVELLTLPVAIWGRTSGRREQGSERLGQDSPGRGHSLQEGHWGYRSAWPSRSPPCTPAARPP